MRLGEQTMKIQELQSMNETALTNDQPGDETQRLVDEN